MAIGNGTASRESEKLVAEAISEYNDKDVKYVIVSEAGASVYSASEMAISEFPDLTVEKEVLLVLLEDFKILYLNLLRLIVRVLVLVNINMMLMRRN